MDIFDFVYDNINLDDEIVIHGNTKIILNDKVEFMNPIVSKLRNHKDVLILVEKNEYAIEINNLGLNFYVGNTQIDVSEDTIISKKKIANEDFVLDIFNLCDNINYYNWEDSDVCDFHKFRDSSIYGPDSRSFTRINKIFVRIEYGSCCCSYSGGEAYFNLLKNKNMYGSCSCFLDQKKIDHVLGNVDCDCDSSSSDNRSDNLSECTVEDAN